MRKHHKLAFLMACCLPAFALARAPVIDATPSGIYQQPTPLTPEQEAKQAANVNARLTKLEQSSAEYQSLLGKVVQLNQTVQDLRNLMAIQGQEIQQLQQQLHAGHARQAMPIKPSTPTVAVAAKPRKHHSVVTSSEAKRAYKTAYSLIKSQHYSEALPALENFVGRYPNASETGSAYYWVGQLQAVNGNAQLAQKNFMIVATRYPKASEAPNAMLRLGEILMDQHQTAQAQHWFSEIIQDYPNSSAARLARLKQAN